MSEQVNYELPRAAEAVVVGGGIGGLTAAYELTRHGVKPLVVEAFTWPGGVIGRHEVGGMLLDAGAESFAVANGACEALIADLGAADRVVRPNTVGAWVKHAGGDNRLPVGGVLGIPGDPMAADVIDILGPDGAARAARDRDLPPDVGFNPDGMTTLGGLVRARMGDRVVERLVEPVVGGVHSSDPDGLDVDVIQPALRGAIARNGNLQDAVAELRGKAGRAGSAVGSMRGGLFVLVDLLVDAIEKAGGRVVCSRPVSIVARNDKNDGWTVSLPATKDLPPAEISTPVVILATPAKNASPLIAPWAPKAAELMRDAPASKVRLVELVVDTPDLDTAPRGTGVLVSSACHDVTAKAMTHVTVKWAWLRQQLDAAGHPHRHVLRVSFGREGEALPGPDQAVTIALRDAATIAGVPIPEYALVDARSIVWGQGMPKADATHTRRLAAARAAVDAAPGLELVGAFTAGTGLAAIVKDARERAATMAATMGGRG